MVLEDDLREELWGVADRVWIKEDKYLGNIVEVHKVLVSGQRFVPPSSLREFKETRYLICSNGTYQAKHHMCILTATKVAEMIYDELANDYIERASELEPTFGIF